MPTAYLSPSQLQDLTNVSSNAPGSGDNGKALVWNWNSTTGTGQWQAQQVAYSNLSGAPALPIPVANGGTGTQTGSITGTGALTFAAGGTNQNVNITPSGTGELAVSGQALRITQPSGNTAGYGFNFQKSGSSGFFTIINGTTGVADFAPFFFAASTTGSAMSFAGLQGGGVDNSTGVIWFSARNSSGTGAIADSHKAFVFSNFGTARVTIDGSGDTVFLSTTESTLTTNGAVRVNGGVGIAKNLNVGGTKVNFANLPISSTGLSAGDLWRDGEIVKVKL
jgi:hypothetical protein